MYLDGLRYNTTVPLFFSALGGICGDLLNGGVPALEAR